MSGWSRRGPGDEDHPALSEAGQGQRLLKWALDTKLFEGSAETGRRPRHRRIAEFLAAKYLDHAIRRERVSASRVLALMKGVDGVVMPDLRGVSVWLAARNSDVRGPLIAADPVGVAFYGDARGFSRPHTALLLRGLETRLNHEWDWPSSASLGALMTGPARECYGTCFRPRIARVPGRGWSNRCFTEWPRPRWAAFCRKRPGRLKQRTRRERFCWP